MLAHDLMFADTFWSHQITVGDIVMSSLWAIGILVMTTALALLIGAAIEWILHDDDIIGPPHG